MVFKKNDFLHKKMRFIDDVTKSQFLSEAALIFVLSLISKVILFFGMAYAAKCLGPSNLGISARVQTVVQQLSILFNGGFDYVAVRHIAANRGTMIRKAGSVILFRLLVSLLLALFWIIIIQSNHSLSDLERLIWLLGPVLLIISSLNSSFVYQAVERLSLFTFFISVGSIITALTILTTFHPKMPLGSDLLVTVVVSTISSMVAFIFIFRKIRFASFLEFFTKSVSAISDLRSLLVYSWRYWLIAVTVYIYSGLPILLISHYEGDYASGIFRAGFMMAAALELFFGSFNSLLLPKFVKLKENGLHKLWLNQTRLLKFYLVIGFVVGLISVLTAPFFLSKFLGAQFAESVQIFQILVLGRVIVFIGQIYALGIVALHLDREFMWASLVGALVSLFLNCLIIPSYGVVGAAWVIVFTELLIHFSFYLSQRKNVLTAQG